MNCIHLIPRLLKLNLFSGWLWATISFDDASSFSQGQWSGVHISERSWTPSAICCPAFSKWHLSCAKCVHGQTAVRKNETAHGPRSLATVHDRQHAAQTLCCRTMLNSSWCKKKSACDSVSLCFVCLLCGRSAVTSQDFVSRNTPPASATTSTPASWRSASSQQAAQRARAVTQPGAERLSARNLVKKNKDTGLVVYM